MNLAEQFETEKKLMPTHAAKIIGVSYSLWKKLRTGEKPLQPYHIASIEAHQALSNSQFEKLKAKRT
jgi:hypothetical protein